MGGKKRDSESEWRETCPSWKATTKLILERGKVHINGEKGERYLYDRA